MAFTGTPSWRAFLLGTLLATNQALPADLVQHLFPHKDGEIANTGNNQDPLLEVGNSGSKAWILYQTGGTDLSSTTGANLTLYLDSVHASGTLKVFALESAVPAPELDVASGDLVYDDLDPWTEVGVTTADGEKTLRIDLDSLLASGPFHGLVLEAADGLRVDIGSKDGHLQPLIELKYASATPEQVNAAITAATDAAAAASAILFTTSSTTPSGFSSTGVRISSESPSPWNVKTSLSPARLSLASAVLAGKLHIVGGRASGATFYDTHQSYDPATNAWTTLAGMPASLSNLTLTEAGGYLYAIGGRDNSSTKSSVYRYDPGTNVWSTMASLSMARMDHRTVSYAGKIHVLDGDPNATGVETTSHEVYDIAGNSWSAGTALPTARYGFSASEVGGKFYLIGGVTSAGSPSALNQAYVPVSSTWSTLTPMDRPRYAQATVVANGLIYMFAGNRTSAISDCEQYDPVSDTFTPVSSAPSARSWLAGGLIGGKAHIVGGYDGSNPLATHEAYSIPVTLFGILRD